MNTIKYSCTVCKKWYPAGTGVIMFEQNLKETHYCTYCSKSRNKKKK